MLNLRQLFVSFIALLLSEPAFAGDAAELNILGFNKTGEIFAFEEFGTQDGSGFAYANRFYIDTATDTYISGTPIRILVESEPADISQARKQAAEAGQKIVGDAELSAHRGYTVASRAMTQISDDEHEFLFNPRPVFPAIDPQIGFRLEPIDLAAPANCTPDDKPKGFRLLRQTPDAPGNTATIHEDKSIPASRRCPLGYRLGAVQTVFVDGGSSYFAVLIAVISRGFEGPDHRWLAVTGKL